MPTHPSFRRTCIGALVGVALAVGAPQAWSDPVYVAISGSDFSPGTQASPVRTIAQGIYLANLAGGQPVYIGEGLYSETVSLANNVSLYGGFAPADGWSRDPVAHLTTIEGGTTAVLGDGAHGVTLDGLLIRSSNSGPAGSSIGVFLKSCLSVSVINCRIEAGNGGLGAPGSSGTAGSNGNNGVVVLRYQFKK